VYSIDKENFNDINIKISPPYPILLINGPNVEGSFLLRQYREYFVFLPITSLLK
jgi:hypothetical protein